MQCILPPSATALRQPYLSVPTKCSSIHSKFTLAGLARVLIPLSCSAPEPRPPPLHPPSCLYAFTFSSPLPRHKSIPAGQRGSGNFNRACRGISTRWLLLCDLSTYLLTSELTLGSAVELNARLNDRRQHHHHSSVHVSSGSDYSGIRYLLARTITARTRLN